MKYIVTTREVVIRSRLVEADNKSAAAAEARKGLGDIEDHLGIEKIKIIRVDEE